MNTGVSVRGVVGVIWVGCNRRGYARDLQGLGPIGGDEMLRLGSAR